MKPLLHYRSMSGAAGDGDCHGVSARGSALLSGRLVRFIWMFMPHQVNFAGRATDIPVD